MAISTQRISTKMNLKYEKEGTLSYSISDIATNQDIYTLAVAVNALQSVPLTAVQKTVVEQLINI